MQRDSPEHWFSVYQSTGEREALGRSLNQVGGRLFAEARRITRDDEAAADLVQSTFLTAILNLEHRGIAAHIVAEDDGRAAVELFAGRYVLAARGGNFVDFDRAFDIRAGETTRLAIELQPARDCEFVFPFERDGRAFGGVGRLRLTIRGGDGAIAHRSMAREPSEARYWYRVGLVPGDYVVEAVVPWGARGSARFSVPAIGATPHQVDVPLR